MTSAARRLPMLGALLLVVMVAGAVVAIAAGWPAQFGGRGDPSNVAGEALTRGTALSPPVAPVLVYIVALVAALRPGRIGTAGTVLLILVSAVFVIGGLGEAFAPATPDVPRLALVVSGLLAFLLGACVIVAAVGRLSHGVPRGTAPVIR